mgnify:CR=1 FL=1
MSDKNSSKSSRSSSSSSSHSEKRASGDAPADAAGGASPASRKGGEASQLMNSIGELLTREALNDHVTRLFEDSDSGTVFRSDYLELLVDLNIITNAKDPRALELLPDDVVDLDQALAVAFALANFTDSTGDVTVTASKIVKVQPLEYFKLVLLCRRDPSVVYHVHWPSFRLSPTSKIVTAASIVAVLASFLVALTVTLLSYQLQRDVDLAHRGTQVQTAVTFLDHFLVTAKQRTASSVEGYVSMVSAGLSHHVNVSTSVRAVIDQRLATGAAGVIARRAHQLYGIIPLRTADRLMRLLQQWPNATAAASSPRPLLWSATRSLNASRGSSLWALQASPAGGAWAVLDVARNSSSANGLTVVPLMLYHNLDGPLLADTDQRCTTMPCASSVSLAVPDASATGGAETLLQRLRRLCTTAYRSLDRGAASALSSPQRVRLQRPLDADNVTVATPTNVLLSRMSRSSVPNLVQCSVPVSELLTAAANDAQRSTLIGGPSTLAEIAATPNASTSALGALIRGVLMQSAAPVAAAIAQAGSVEARSTGAAMPTPRLVNFVISATDWNARPTTTPRTARGSDSAVIVASVTTSPLSGSRCDFVASTTAAPSGCLVLQELLDESLDGHIAISATEEVALLLTDTMAPFSSLPFPTADASRSRQLVDPAGTTVPGVGVVSLGTLISPSTTLTPAPSGTSDGSANTIVLGLHVVVQSLFPGERASLLAVVASIFAHSNPSARAEDDAAAPFQLSADRSPVPRGNKQLFVREPLTGSITLRSESQPAAGAAAGSAKKCVLENCALPAEATAVLVSAASRPGVAATQLECIDEYFSPVIVVARSTAAPFVDDLIIGVQISRHAVHRAAVAVAARAFAAFNDQFTTPSLDALGRTDQRASNRLWFAHPPELPFTPVFDMSSPCSDTVVCRSFVDVGILQRSDCTTCRPMRLSGPKSIVSSTVTAWSSPKNYSQERRCTIFVDPADVSLDVTDRLLGAIARDDASAASTAVVVPNCSAPLVSAANRLTRFVQHDGFVSSFVVPPDSYFTSGLPSSSQSLSDSQGDGPWSTSTGFDAPTAFATGTYSRRGTSNLVRFATGLIRQASVVISYESNVDDFNAFRWYYDIIAYAVSAACMVVCLIVLLASLQKIMRLLSDEWAQYNSKKEEESLNFASAIADVMPMIAAEARMQRQRVYFAESRPVVVAFVNACRFGDDVVAKYDAHSIVVALSYVSVTMWEVCQRYRVHKVRSFGDGVLLVGGVSVDGGAEDSSLRAEQSSGSPTTDRDGASTASRLPPISVATVDTISALICIQKLLGYAFEHHPENVPALRNGAITVDDRFVLPKLNYRMSCHLGPASLVVVPTSSIPHFDVLGPTVGVAADICRSARPLSIQVTEAVTEQLRVAGFLDRIGMGEEHRLGCRSGFFRVARISGASLAPSKALLRSLGIRRADARNFLGFELQKSENISRNQTTVSGSVMSDPMLRKDSAPAAKAVDDDDDLFRGVL